MCPIADDKGIIFFFFPPPLPPTQEEALPPYIPNPLLQKFLLLTADSTGKLDTQQLDLGYRVQRSKESCKDFLFSRKVCLKWKIFFLKSFAMKNVLALIPQEIQFHMGQQQWHFSSFLGTVCAVKRQYIQCATYCGILPDFQRFCQPHKVCYILCATLF